MRAPLQNRNRKHQEGNILIMASIVLSTAIILLASIDIGFLFYQKRELQKIADLAALAGAQQLSACANDLNDNAAARRNAESNGYAAPDTLTVRCGNWDPAHTQVDHFDETKIPVNAIKVTVMRKMSLFFNQINAREVSASAVASSSSVATFSVGTRLAQTNLGLLHPVLKGIGLDLNDLSLIGYDGLANLSVTPAGLLQALDVEVPIGLNVGQINQLLATEVHARALIDVLDATIKAANGPRSLLDANAALVDAIEAKLKASDLSVQLGSDGLRPTGLFAQITNTSGDAALNARVNALDLIGTAVGVATQRHAIEINDLSVNLPSLTSVELKASLIEPPSIAIGGVGAQAYTGQLRTYARVKIGTSNIPLIGSMVKLDLDLPIMIDAATAKATIEEMCTPDLRTSSRQDQARFSIQGELLKVCIGEPKNNDQIFSNTDACENNIDNVNLLSIGFLGTNLARINGQVHIPAFPVQHEVILAQGQQGAVNTALNLGTTVDNITRALLGLLIGDSIAQSPKLTASQAGEMASKLWGSACTSSNCRKTKIANIRDQISSASTGLQGPIGDLLDNTLGITSNLLTLDLVGVLSGVGSLVGDLLGTVSDILGGVLGIVTGHPCTGGGLFNLPGSDQACTTEIEKLLLDNSQSSNGFQKQNAVLALLGFVLQSLSPILEGLGNNLLTPLLENALGLNLGVIEVDLRSLQCNAGVRLVY